MQIKQNAATAQITFVGMVCMAGAKNSAASGIIEAVAFITCTTLYVRSKRRFFVIFL